MSYKVFPTFYHGKRGVINADNVHKCPLLLLHIFLFSKCPPFWPGWRARSREGHVGLQWGLQFKSEPSLIIVLPASQDEYILQTKLKLHKIWQSFCMYSPPGPAPAKTTQSEAFTFQLNLFFFVKKMNFPTAEFSLDCNFLCSHTQRDGSRSQLFCRCWSDLVTLKLNFEQALFSEKE